MVERDREGDRALRGEVEENVTKIFPGVKDARWVEAKKISYVRIIGTEVNDHGEHNVVDYKSYVPAWHQVQMINGIDVKFTQA